MKSRYRSRKFILLIVLMAVGTGIWYIADAPFQQWFEMTKWFFGIYVTGNCGEHATKAVQKGVMKMGPKGSDPSKKAA